MTPDSSSTPTPPTSSVAWSSTATPRDHHDWLFPGKHPLRPAAAKTLAERLNRIGVTRNARVAAFHDLAAQIPSPVLAELIGYNPNFLAERATALGVPWPTYPALRTPG